MGFALVLLGCIVAGVGVFCAISWYEKNEEKKRTEALQSVATLPRRSYKTRAEISAGIRTRGIRAVTSG